MLRQLLRHLTTHSSHVFVYDCFDRSRDGTKTIQLLIKCRVPIISDFPFQPINEGVRKYKNGFLFIPSELLFARLGIYRLIFPAAFSSVR